MAFFHEMEKEIQESAVLSETPPFPRRFMLEPTNACNLACVFCSHSRSRLPVCRLPMGKVERILSDAYRGGAREVGFYRCGEPLLHRGLAGMLRMAKDIGYEYIYITSNGVLMTRERLEELIACGLNSLKISINAGDRESYRRIHGVDAFETVKKNLLDCIDLRHRSEERSGAFQRLFVSCIYVDEIDSAASGFKREIQSGLDDFILKKAGKYNDSRRETGCVRMQPFTTFGITSGGLLSACCVDHDNDLVVSNLENETIVEAWRNPAFRELRRRFLAKDLAGLLCGNCLSDSAEPVRPLAQVIKPC